MFTETTGSLLSKLTIEIPHQNMGKFCLKEDLPLHKGPKCIKKDFFHPILMDLSDQRKKSVAF